MSAWADCSLQMHVDDDGEMTLWNQETYLINGVVLASNRFLPLRMRLSTEKHLASHPPVPNNQTKKI